MSVTTTLAQLWEREELPIRDALYLADGRAFTVRLDDQAPGGLSIGDPFDLDALLAEDPEWVTSIVVSKQVDLDDERGYVCCGEGSWGSEGVFARLSPTSTPAWVVYLERSNPFTDIDIDASGQVVRFRSTSGVQVSAALTSADFVPTPWPAAS